MADSGTGSYTEKDGAQLSLTLSEKAAATPVQNKTGLPPADCSQAVGITPEGRTIVGKEECEHAEKECIGGNEVVIHGDHQAGIVTWEEETLNNNWVPLSTKVNHVLEENFKNDINKQFDFEEDDVKLSFNLASYTKVDKETQNETNIRRVDRIQVYAGCFDEKSCEHMNPTEAENQLSFKNDLDGTVRDSITRGEDSKNIFDSPTIKSFIVRGNGIWLIKIRGGKVYSLPFVFTTTPKVECFEGFQHINHQDVWYRLNYSSMGKLCLQNVQSKNYIELYEFSESLHGRNETDQKCTNGRHGFSNECTIAETLTVLKGFRNSSADTDHKTGGEIVTKTDKKECKRHENDTNERDTDEKHNENTEEKSETGASISFEGNIVNKLQAETGLAQDLNFPRTQMGIHNFMKGFSGGEASHLSGHTDKTNEKDQIQTTNEEVNPLQARSMNFGPLGETNKTILQETSVENSQEKQDHTARNERGQTLSGGTSQMKKEYMSSDQTEIPEGNLSQDASALAHEADIAGNFKDTLGLTVAEIIHEFSEEETDHTLEGHGETSEVSLDQIYEKEKHHQSISNAEEAEDEDEGRSDGDSASKDPLAVEDQAMHGRESIPEGRTGLEGSDKIPKYVDKISLLCASASEIISEERPPDPPSRKRKKDSTKSVTEKSKQLDWRSNEGNSHDLKLLINYPKKQGGKNITDVFKHVISCSLNFKLMWNFCMQTDCGKKIIDPIVVKHCCQISLHDDDDLKEFFKFKVSDEQFQDESSVKDFVDAVLHKVYNCAQESLSIQSVKIDPRIKEDVLDKLKERKEVGFTWIELVGEGNSVAVYSISQVEHQTSAMQIMKAVIADASESFFSHENMVDVNYMWHTVLTKLEYLVGMDVMFPNTKISQDEEKNDVFLLKGHRDEVEAAVIHLKELQKKAREEVQEQICYLGDKFEHFTYSEMHHYIDTVVTEQYSQCVAWIPNHQTKKIHIFSRRQAKNIDKIIKGCVQVKQYQLSKIHPRHIRLIEELKNKYRGKLVIHQSNAGLLVTAADDIFESVDTTMQEILEMIARESDTVSESPHDKDGQVRHKMEPNIADVHQETSGLLSEKDKTPDRVITRNIRVRDENIFRKILQQHFSEFKENASKHGINICILDAPDKFGFQLKGSEKEVAQMSSDLEERIKSESMHLHLPKEDNSAGYTENVEDKTNSSPDDVGRTQSAVGLIPQACENLAFQAVDQGEHQINIDTVWQVALDKFGYLSEIHEMFPSLTLILDETSEICVIKGPKKNIKTVAHRLTELLHMAQQNIHRISFCPCKQFEILTCPEMQQYIEGRIMFEMKQTKYAWIQNFKTNEVYVLAEDKVHCEKIVMVIKGCIREEEVPLPAQINDEQKTKLLEKTFSSHKGKIWIKHDKSHIFFLTTADDIFECVWEELQANITKYLTLEKSTKKFMEDKSLTDPRLASENGATTMVSGVACEKILVENRSVYECMIKVVRWIKKTGLEHAVEVRELNEPLRVGFVLQGPSDKVRQMIDYIKKVQEGIITQNYSAFSASEVSFLGSAEGEQILAKLEEENNCTIEITCPGKVTLVEDLYSGGAMGSCMMVTFIFPHNHSVILFNGEVEKWTTDIIVTPVLSPFSSTGPQKPPFILKESAKLNMFVPLCNESNPKAKYSLIQNICATLDYTVDKQCGKVGFAISPLGGWDLTKYIKFFLYEISDFFSKSQGITGRKVYLCTSDMDMFARMKGAAIDYFSSFITGHNKAVDLYTVDFDASSIKEPVLHFDKIEVRVEAGELSKMEADVIVNTTSEKLDLNGGTISKSILKAAGQTIQDECKKTYPNGIRLGKVAKTSGGKMKCKNIFHGALKPHTSQDWDKILKTFVNACLTQASDLKFKSIAFPALGTGTLELPRDQVALIMTNCVKEFSSRQSHTLEKVTFVIYHKDKSTLKVFQDTILKFKPAEKEKTESSGFEIHVTGLKDTVNEVIASIKTKLKRLTYEDHPASEDKLEKNIGAIPPTISQPSKGAAVEQKSSGAFMNLAIMDYSEEKCCAVVSGEIRSKEELEKDITNFWRRPKYVVYPYDVEKKTALIIFESEEEKTESSDFEIHVTGLKDKVKEVITSVETELKKVPEEDTDVPGSCPSATNLSEVDQDDSIVYIECKIEVAEDILNSIKITYGQQGIDSLISDLDKLAKVDTQKDRILVFCDYKDAENVQKCVRNHYNKVNEERKMKEENKHLIHGENENLKEWLQFAYGHTSWSKNLQLEGGKLYLTGTLQMKREVGKAVHAMNYWYKEEFTLNSEEQQKADEVVAVIKSELPTIFIKQTKEIIIVLSDNRDNFERACFKVKVALGRIKITARGRRHRDPLSYDESYSGLSKNDKMDAEPY